MSSDGVRIHRHDHSHGHDHGYHPHGRPLGDEGLDSVHEAIKSYLGGNLSLVPLEGSMSPRSILEMGSGSGAWAIQAAERFPEADVLAVDLSPLPSKPMPSNLKFQILDLTKPCPLGPQTFDIVHSRFVFHHLANFEEVLDRAIQLVTPGGWLLLEEVEFRDDDELVPGCGAFWKQFQYVMMGKDSNPRVGSALQEILESSGHFSQVNVRKIVVPISKCDEPHVDVGVRGIAEPFKAMLSRALVGVKENVATNHLKVEDIDAALMDLKDPSGNIEMDIYMTWSRRGES